MGGDSSPLKKAVKQIKRISAEDVLSFGTKPLFNKVRDKTGLKLDFVNPVSAVAVAGEAGERFVDKPKRAKEFSKVLASEADRTQKEFKAEFNLKKKQADAEKSASEDLLKGRRRQTRRKREAKEAGTATGGSSTIATGSKSLLGQ